MNILSIETSADESGVAVIQADGDFPTATYNVLGNALRTQVEMHKEYGGIFPTVAKREHAKALVPLLEIALSEAELLIADATTLDEETQTKLADLLHREPELNERLVNFIANYQPPAIDLIAVTTGPGLEPALWVGINFAKALALLWDIPVVPVNHMEGHVLASIFDTDVDNGLPAIEFPAISLLISGGHTELLLQKNWGLYEKIGQTRDDAVGEAFDKVARMMDLPYPGGPEIGRLAATARQNNLPSFTNLPTPMLNSGDLDFSFSGLKTAVRYAIANQSLTETDKAALARDFEDVVGAVLLKKTAAAIDIHTAHTLIVGGGVSASPYLKQLFETHFLRTHPDLSVYFPAPGLSTDNALMIALSGHARADGALSASGTQALTARSNWSLAGS